MSSTNSEEYYCSKCKNPVSDSDVVCPNCGADLNIVAEEFKYSKTYHRFIFYLIIFPIFSVIIGFMLSFVYSTFFPDDSSFFREKITIAIFSLSNLVFPYIFIRLSKNKNFLLGIIISLLSYSVFYILYELGFAATTGFWIVLIFFNELSFTYFKSEKKYIPIIIITLFFIWFFTIGLDKVPISQAYEKLFENVNIEDIDNTILYLENSYSNGEQAINIYYYEDKTDTLRYVLIFDKTYKNIIPGWKFNRIEKRL